MWAEAYQATLRPHRTPEILETDLIPVILELARWGNPDPAAYEWLSPPPPAAVSQALFFLQLTGAIGEDKRITEKGKGLASFPAHPRIGSLAWNTKGKEAALAADLAAVLEERDILGQEHGADLYFRVEALRKFRKGEFVRTHRPLKPVAASASRWLRLLDAGEDNSAPDPSLTGELLFRAFPDRVAMNTGTRGKFRLAAGGNASLPEEDSLSGEKLLVIVEMGLRKNEGKIFLATELPEKIASGLTRWIKVCDWNYQEEKLVMREEKQLGSLVLDSRPLQDVPSGKIKTILSEVIRNRGMEYLQWDEETMNLISRVRCARLWDQNSGLPEITKEGLLSDPGAWAGDAFLRARTKDDFRKIPLYPLISHLLTWDEMQKLEALAPASLKVPSGSEIKLQYNGDGSAPILSVRLQEMFGQLETPRICRGKVPVKIELLSPAYRPVQLTMDLGSFWKSAYQEVRKELRMRYPKHSWPEDPFSAQAVKGVKRKRSE